MRGYRLVDWLTQGYLGLIAVLILLFHGSALPAWPYYVAAHAVGTASSSTWTSGCSARSCVAP